jgi:hypothetical protein
MNVINKCVRNFGELFGQAVNEAVDAESSM